MNVPATQNRLIVDTPYAEENYEVRHLGQINPGATIACSDVPKSQPRDDRPATGLYCPHHTHNTIRPTVLGGFWAQKKPRPEPGQVLHG